MEFEPGKTIVLPDKLTEVMIQKGTTGKFEVAIQKYDGEKYNPLTDEEFFKIIQDGIKFQMLRERKEIKKEME